MSAGFRLSFVLVGPNVHPQGLIMDYGNGFSRDCHYAVGINSPAIGIRGPCLRKTASSSASAALPVRSMGSACRSEEHTSELQSLMRHSYDVFCLKKKKRKSLHHNHNH